MLIQVMPEKIAATCPYYPFDVGIALTEVPK